MASEPHSPTARNWDLMDRARQLAELGDEWLVSLGRRLGRIGGRAEHEATQSATSAPASPAACSEPKSERSAPSEPTVGGAESRSRGRAGCAVLDAIPAGARADATPAEEQGHPPGVLPLVQALGRVVTEHADRDFVTLAGDERLWPLVELLESLAGPRLREPFLPDTPDSVEAAEEVPAARGSETFVSQNERRKGCTLTG